MTTIRSPGGRHGGNRNTKGILSIILLVFVVVLLFSRFRPEESSYFDVLHVEDTSGPPRTTQFMMAPSSYHHHNYSSWCPDDDSSSLCIDSPFCSPCQRRYLIIFSTGRSASTTLTWMMDSLPGVRLSGENNALLQRQFLTHQAVFEDKRFTEGQQGKSSPYGRNKVPDGALACILQNTIEIITPPKKIPVDNPDKEASTIIGFKTIRSHRSIKGFDIQQFAKYLTTNLPCARFLFNYRSDTTALAKSLQQNFGWTQNLTWIQDRMEQETRNLLSLYDALGSERAYLLDSSTWTKDVGLLNKAVEWLGFSDACHFTELLEFNTVQRKGQKYGNARTSFANPNKNCTMI